MTNWFDDMSEEVMEARTRNTSRFLLEYDLDIYFMITLDYHWLESRWSLSIQHHIHWIRICRTTSKQHAGIADKITVLVGSCNRHWSPHNIQVVFYRPKIHPILQTKFLRQTLVFTQSTGSLKTYCSGRLLQSRKSFSGNNLGSFFCEISRPGLV